MVIQRSGSHLRSPPMHTTTPPPQLRMCLSHTDLPIYIHRHRYGCTHTHTCIHMQRHTSSQVTHAHASMHHAYANSHTPLTPYSHLSMCTHTHRGINICTEMLLLTHTHMQEHTCAHTWTNIGKAHTYLLHADIYTYVRMCMHTFINAHQSILSSVLCLYCRCPLHEFSGGGSPAKTLASKKGQGSSMPLPHPVQNTLWSCKCTSKHTCLRGALSGFTHTDTNTPRPVCSLKASGPSPQSGSNPYSPYIPRFCRASK
jgi:hypothetical protein